MTQSGGWQDPFDFPLSYCSYCLRSCGTRTLPLDPAPCVGHFALRGAFSPRCGLLGCALLAGRDVQIEASRPRRPDRDVQTETSRPRRPDRDVQTQTSRPRRPDRDVQTKTLQTTTSDHDSPDHDVRPRRQTRTHSPPPRQTSPHHHHTTLETLGA